MTQRPRKLERQIKRHLGAEDAEALIGDLHQQIAAGKPVAGHPALPVLASVSRFIDDIAETYQHQDETVKLHIRNANLSSDELNEVNASLAHLNHSLSTIMESLGEGLLFFDQQGFCSDVFSRACLDMFGQSPANRKIWELLQLDDAERCSLQNLLDLIFTADTAMSFEDMMALAPTLFQRDGHTISLEYRPVEDAEGNLRAVVMVAIDRTAELQAEARASQKEQEASRIIRISKNRNAFIRLVNNMRLLFERLETTLASDQGASQLRRDIHTFKGLAGSFYLTQLSDYLHDLETRLRDKPPEEIARICRRDQDKLLEHLDRAVEAASDWLGNNFERLGSVRMIASNELMEFGDNLRHLIANGADADAIQKLFLEQLASVPVWEALSVFELQMHELAERLGKRLQPVRFSGSNFPLVADIYQDVLDALVHVGRNIIDHGIEEPSLRRQLNKSEAGVVTLKTSRSSRADGEWLRIVIEDDGAGINTENLRSKLIERGIIKKTAQISDEEIVAHVFDDEVSTARSVSSTSGRGIGMGAVKASIEALGGRVSMTSKPGFGCTLTIDLPYLWSRPVAGAAHPTHEPETVRH
jgi:two-component system, chemotaxis family, sensor kinase CheA